MQQILLSIFQTNSIFGPHQCVNHLSLLFAYYLLLDTARGSRKIHLNCSTLKGSCKVCYRKLTWTQGIFCSNFMVSVKNCPPCQNSWCENCYVSRKDIKIHRKASYFSKKARQSFTLTF